MKEIVSSHGGRFRYNEDIKALQESALAITEFLKQLDENFVLSGCKNNSSGYVWLDGKIRYVEAVSVSTTYNYIVAEDTDGIEIEYHNHELHQMNINYGAKYSSSASTSAKTIAKLSELNDFPRLGYALFHKFSVDKVSKEKSEINAPVDFSDALAASGFVINIGSAVLRMTIEYPYFVITIQNNGKTSQLKLPFYDHTIRFKGNDNEWSVSNLDVGYSDSGELYFDSIDIRDLVIRINLVCNDLQVLSSNGTYLSIANILQNNNIDISCSTTKFYNIKTNEECKYINVKKSNGIVTINGLLPIEYILGETYDSCHAGNPFYLSDIIESNKYHTLVQSYTNTSGITVLKIYTSLYLKSSEFYPTKNMLPGIMLCSDMVSYYGEDHFNGNMQLMIDETGRICLLMAFEQQREYIDFVINNSYIDETNEESKLGVTFNLTYLV